MALLSDPNKHTLRYWWAWSVAQVRYFLASSPASSPAVSFVALVPAPGVSLLLFLRLVVSSSALIDLVRSTVLFGAFPSKKRHLFSFLT